MGGAMRRWAGSVIKGRGYTEMGGAKAPIIRLPNEKGRGYASGRGDAQVGGVIDKGAGLYGDGRG